MEVDILCHDKQIKNYLIAGQILLRLEKNVSIQLSQFQVVSVKVRLVQPLKANHREQILHISARVDVFKQMLHENNIDGFILFQLY